MAKPVEIPGIGFDAGDILAQHGETGFSGHIELGQGLFGDDAAGQHAVIDLEGAHGFGQFIVIDGGILAAQCIEGKIVLGHEALAERLHIRALGALLQAAHRQWLPAAAGDDFLIDGDGSRHRLGRAGRQHRDLIEARDDLGLGGELAVGWRCAGATVEMELVKTGSSARAGASGTHGEKASQTEKIAIESAARQHVNSPGPDCIRQWASLVNGPLIETRYTGLRPE